MTDSTDPLLAFGAGFFFGKSQKAVYNMRSMYTMPPRKKVKIVATLGPKSESAEMILSLAQRGVDVFRFNMSHCPREEAFLRRDAIREAEKSVGKKLTIMGDLMGPKIRIGAVEPEQITLRGGAILELRHGDEVGNDSLLYIAIPDVIENLKENDEIYLGDGDIKLRVDASHGNGVFAHVLVGGELRSRMGFSAPSLARARFALTEKDKADIALMHEVGADALAVSFVQSAEDITAVQQEIPEGWNPHVIAKIETLAGVENAESILEFADGLMVARGDLGFAVPMAEIPHIQKNLIKLCLEKAKPVITATQMLESMTWNFLPTRAEITDVANAILDGTDAVMLSGETAKGKYPVASVETMSKIILSAETKVVPRTYHLESSQPESVTSAVVKVANDINAKIIVAFSESGRTIRLIARHRTDQIIIAISPNKQTITDLNFVWGVIPLEARDIVSVDDMTEVAQQFLLELSKQGALTIMPGEPFVIAAGIPFGQSGTTNLLLVERYTPPKK